MLYHIWRFLFGISSRERSAYLITQAIKEHSRTMVSLVEKLEPLLAKIDSSQVSEDELAEHLNPIKEEISTLEGKVTELEGTISEKETRITDLETVVTQIAEALAAGNTEEAASLANAAIPTVEETVSGSES